MKIAQIAGFLGSGKTTALMKIVDGLVKKITMQLISSIQRLSLL